MGQFELDSLLKIAGYDSDAAKAIAMTASDDRIDTLWKTGTLSTGQVSHRPPGPTTLPGHPTEEMATARGLRADSQSVITGQ